MDFACDNEVEPSHFVASQVRRAFTFLKLLVEAFKHLHLVLVEVDRKSFYEARLGQLGCSLGVRLVQDGTFD